MKLLLIILAIIVAALVAFFVWLFKIAKDAPGPRNNFPFVSLIVLMLISLTAQGQFVPVKGWLDTIPLSAVQPLYRPSTVAVDTNYWMPKKHNDSRDSVIQAHRDEINHDLLSTPKMSGSWGWDTSTFSTSITKISMDTILPRYDTTEVLMLVTDTALYADSLFYADRSSGPVSADSAIYPRWHYFKMTDPAAKYIKGYEVRGVYVYWGGRTDYSTAYAVAQTGQAYLNKQFSHVAYLSPDKKPLPASIVVWMVKPMNQLLFKYNGL